MAKKPRLKSMDHDIDINGVSLNVTGDFAMRSGSVLLIEDEEGVNDDPMHICCIVNKKSGTKLRFTALCSSIWYNSVSFDTTSVANTVQVFLNASQPSTLRKHVMNSTDVDDTGEDIDVEFYEVSDIATTKKSYGKKPKHTIVYSGIVVEKGKK